MRRVGLILVQIVGFAGYYFSASDVVARLFQHGADESHPISNIIAVSTLCVFSLLLLIIAVYSSITSARRSRYANVTDSTHAVAHEVRDLSWHLRGLVYENVDKAAMRAGYNLAHARMQIILSDIAKVFSIVTATNCRVSIKTYYKDSNNELYIRTLVRDAQSQTIYGALDARDSANMVNKAELYPHLKRIMTEIGKCPGGIANNIINLSPRKFSLIERIVTKRREWRELKRSVSEKPYRSTMYYSIRQFKSTEYEFPEQGSIGVLQVDSPSRGVFDSRWDLGLMATFSDALFHTLRLHTQLADKINRA